MTDGTTSTFVIFNGEKGEKGDRGEDSGEGIYLPLTGGFLSGDLNLRHSDYIKGGTAPSSNLTRRVAFYDNSEGTTESSRTGMLYNCITNAGDSITSLFAYAPIADSTTQCNIYVRYNNDGTKKAGCSEGLVFYGACWNDYAEYRETEHIEAGRVVYEKGDDTLSIATERMMPACSIVSDTFGFAIGETEKCKTPLAQAGRVLAYPLEDRNSYKPGDAVCSGPDGTVSKMTKEEKNNYPECIIGYVSCVPNYEIWGKNNTKVNGRIWIKVI